MSGQNGDPLGRGLAASPGQASGPVRFVDIEYPTSEWGRAKVVRSDHVETGDVLLTERLLPSVADAAMRAAAIVTVIRDDERRPGMTSSAAILARECGIPAVVGCTDIRPLLRAGSQVFVDGDEGTVSLQYRARTSTE